MGSANSSTATVGVLSGGYFPHADRSLVWVIEYPDSCVPLYGGRPGDSTPCDAIYSHWSVVVDANSGEFIAAYGDH